jgi:hypothetical protein
LAVAIQQTDFFRGAVSRWRQAPFLAAACMLAPLVTWLKLLGVTLLAVALLPTLLGSQPEKRGRRPQPLNAAQLFFAPARNKWDAQ